MASLALAVTLVVRIYDTTGLSQLDRAGAVHVAAEILAAANIPTTWPECGATPKPRPKRSDLVAAASVAGDDGGNGFTGGTEQRRTNGTRQAFVCSRPMDAGEIAVRIVRDSDTSRHPKGSARADRQSLGYSLIDRERGGGTLATMHLDRIEGLAADAVIPARVLMGRAIAHEIGHLLLGDNNHAPHGLMRAVWSRPSLVHGSLADWLFTDEEALALQAALGRAHLLTSDF